jgi:hypothetical protein
MKVIERHGRSGPKPAFNDTLLDALEPRPSLLTESLNSQLQGLAKRLHECLQRADQGDIDAARSAMALGLELRIPYQDGRVQVSARAAHFLAGCL